MLRIFISNPAEQISQVRERALIDGALMRSGDPMRTSHRLLLRLYHDPAFAFEEVRVQYVNRGAPHDRSEIGGDEIQALDRDYMEIESVVGITCIPYHRITEIRYRDEVIWDREFGERL